jgi:ParB-like chromosome segregation protein Spo0J
MYSIDLKENLFVSNELLCVSKILPHEEVVIERMDKLVEYLTSLKPYIIIPSILICSKTNMIIDGHHRFYALQKLGYEKVPITRINYDSNLIKTHIEDTITKNNLLEAALSGKMLPPKSSFHHIIDMNYKLQPIILLSVLTRLDYL